MVVAPTTHPAPPSTTQPHSPSPDVWWVVAHGWGVVERERKPKGELGMSPDKVKSMYRLRQEKLELVQKEALQKAWEYRDQPLYHRGWALRYWKAIEDEKMLALELHAELEATA